MAGGVGFTVKEAKQLFSTQLIADGFDRATTNALFKSGNFVKVVAQRSMRKARQRSVADLSPEELRYYRWQMSRFKKGERKTKPVRGYVASKPGEPPRYREARKLRDFLFSVYDPATQSVVAGPARLGNSTAPKVEEFGGQTRIGERSVEIQPRPYMRPALDKEKAQMAKRWENSLSK